MVNLLEPIEGGKLLQGKWDNIEYNFMVLRGEKFKKGKNLISAVFFLLSNSEKEKAKSYLEGIDKLVKKSQRKWLDITIRLYCDITTIEIVKKYLSFPHVEIYYYYFPQFFDNKLNQHRLLFGTLIRYCPLFTLENHWEDWETVTITDLDNFHYSIFERMEYFVKRSRNPNNKQNLLFRNNKCYYFIERIRPLKLELPQFSIISNFIMQKTPQSPHYFIQYLNNLIYKNDMNLNRVIKYYIKDAKGAKEERLNYGVDEYFLNNIFLPEYYLNKNREFLEYFLIQNHQKNAGILEWFDYMVKIKPTIKNPDIMEQFLKVLVTLLFPKNYNIPNHTDIHQLIAELDKDYRAARKEKHYASKEYYKKLAGIIQKINPELLNMPPNANICFQRELLFDWNGSLIVLVKPDPTYPRYMEKVIHKF